MATLNPYVSFNGNAEEAIKYYGSVFGGEPTLMRYKDTPDSATNCRPEDLNKVMHCSIPIGKGNLLMGCDAPEAMGPLNLGNNISLSITVDSKDEADRIFNELSSKGQVYMPLGDTFWGAYFGMCKDQYGIQWMVDHHQ